MSDVVITKKYVVYGGAVDMVIADDLEVALQLAHERIKDIASGNPAGATNDDGVIVLPVKFAARPAGEQDDGKAWDRDPKIDWTGIEGGHP